MGLQRDGSVIPTPRDRVMPTKEERVFHLVGQKAVAFEIWTTDQEIYRGTSMDEWLDCESEEVQWMMVQLASGQCWEITGVEEYKFQNSRHIKRGPWMDDTAYFTALPEFVRGTSKLL